MWTLTVWNRLRHSHRVYLQGLSSAESAKKYTIGICSYNFLHQEHSYFQISHRRMCRLCITLQWCHSERDCVPNNQPHDCLLNRLFTRRSKITSKLRVTGLCALKSLVTGEFSAQMASNAENVSIWWRHHETRILTDDVRQTWCCNLLPPSVDPFTNMD